MESLDDVLLETDDKMTKSLEFLNQQFSGLRTGKASASLVDHLSVPYYGAAVRLREIANISTPDTRLIVINAYDPTALPAIEKAILSANLGITPLNDGRVIRVPIPELSGERRKELTKVAKQMTEKARVAVRNIRQEANEQIKVLQKGGKITEDEKDQGLKEIQKYTDDAIRKMDQILETKEKEMMSF
ncbi:MAG: ribosome recycling factor [Verrucomicrobia bacterium]|nr:ribosome recycling factor [Verrucomicrobiota bacterium]MBU4246952.1 ribosome recycling factor [Verrucomicrobiota bacterium]MBU4291340.1 ribosome recycling factor [Verrucomicrobiota bacterium]MBU4498083.1 ribosome recycling factor [Verrucomicrobiota bacterium]MCG2680042.1 ribosome recycling factor [Kiritimatiellia bacterium]